MWLDPIPFSLRADAVAALASGDVVGFLITASNEDSMHLVYMNASFLKQRGLYERALLQAFMATRVNNHTWPQEDLVDLFLEADQLQLRALGDPLPGSGPFTVYRGVAGRGRARRVRGLTWTGSIKRAI